MIRKVYLNLRIRYINMTLIELLEQKGTLRVILYLKTKETAILSELKNIDRLAQTALYSAIRKLLDLKLVEESREPPYNKRVFHLTAKGKKVAKLLQEIEKILQSE